MEEHQGEGFLGSFLGFDVKIVDVQTLDVGEEVWEFVEIGLTFFPVVVFGPVVDDFPEEIGIEAIMVSRAFQRRSEPDKYIKKLEVRISEERKKFIREI